MIESNLYAHPPSSCPCLEFPVVRSSLLLLLLLLLRSDQLQLLGLVKKLGPLLVRREVLVGREQGLGRRDPNSNLELRVGFSLHSTHCGRNVGRIATDCGPNVPLPYEQVSRRIETYPAHAWEKSFHPCMRSAFRRGHIFAALVNVSTDVATGNFGISNQCDHDMNEILTYSLSGAKGMLNRQTRRRAFLQVAKTVMHTGGNILQKCQRAPSVSFRRADFSCQLFELRRWARIMTRHQHVPVVFFLDDQFQIGPPFVAYGFGKGGLSVNIYQSVRDDGELAMPGRQVEVVHQVAIGIGISKDAGSRIDRQLKNKTSLVALAPGVHANFHHALPDGMAVAIAREMANGVEH